MSELSNKDQPKKLEDLFRNGMEEAEMAPSDQLWSRIEHNLDLQEKKIYKKKLVWYQQLAAACVLLLLVTTGYLVYDYQLKHDSDKTDLANTRIKVKDNQTKLAANLPLDPAKVKETTPINTPKNTFGKTKVTRGNKEKAASLKASSRTENIEFTEKKARTQPKKPQPAYIAFEDNAAKKNQTNINSAPAKEIEITPLADLALRDQSSDIIKQETKPSLPVEEQSQSLVIAQSDKAIKLDISDSVKASPVTIASAALPVEPAQPKTSRWSFSGKYSPHYFNQNITLGQNQTSTGSPALSNNVVALNSNYSSYSQALNEFDDNTQAGYSFNTEAAVAYELNKNWGIQTGIAYTQNVASTQTSFIFNHSQVTARYAKESLAYGDFNSVTNGNAAVVGVPATALVAALSGPASANANGIIRTQPFTTQYRYQLIGIPVKVNYQTNRTKSFYYASVGFVTNLLVQAHIISDSPRVPDLKYAPNADSPFQNLQLAGVVSVGKGFSITKGLRVRAGLEASQYLNTLVDNAVYGNNRRGKPYSLGVAVSSSYNFNK